MFETSNYEVVVKLLLRYVLAKVIIDNCRGIISIIFSVFSGIATSINAAGNLMLGDAAKQALIDQINVMNGGFAGINYLSFYLKLIPSVLVIFILTLLVSIIVLGRMFEIFVYTAVAPLPVATLAGEMSHDTFKKFMQGYISESDYSIDFIEFDKNQQADMYTVLYLPAGENPLPGDLLIKVNKDDGYYYFAGIIPRSGF